MPVKLIITRNKWIFQAVSWGHSDNIMATTGVHYDYMLTSVRRSCGIGRLSKFIQVLFCLDRYSSSNAGWNSSSNAGCYWEISDIKHYTIVCQTNVLYKNVPYTWNIDLCTCLYQDFLPFVTEKLNRIICNYSGKSQLLFSSLRPNDAYMRR